MEIVVTAVLLVVLALVFYKLSCKAVEQNSDGLGYACAGLFLVMLLVASGLVALLAAGK